jgi:hypothetical protein
MSSSSSSRDRAWELLTRYNKSSGLIAQTIEGMKPVAEEIGLKGNPD